MSVEGRDDRPARNRWSASETTEVPPEAVWLLLADLSQHLEWGGRRYEGRGEYLVTLDAPPGPVSVGTVFTSEGHAHEGTYRDRSTVTAVEAPRLLEFVTETSFRRGRSETRYPLRHRWTLERVGDGALVTHTQERIGDIEGAPLWFRALFVTPLRQLVGDRMALRLLRGGVRNLVAAAEEATAAGSGEGRSTA